MICESIMFHNKVINNNPLKEFVDKDKKIEKMMGKVKEDYEVMSSSSNETLNHAHYIGSLKEVKEESSDEENIAEMVKSGKSHIKKKYCVAS